jgi:hypothetical protein
MVYLWKQVVIKYLYRGYCPTIFEARPKKNDDKSIRTASVRAENVGYYKYERALTHLMRHLVTSVQVSVILLGFHKKNIPL